MAIEKVRKRDGRLEDFDQKKITVAIHRALVALGKKNGKLSRKISNEVVRILEKKFEIPSVEDIQNVVVEVLKKEGLEDVAREYKIYRKKKAELRELRKKFELDAEPKLTVNALEVLRERYLLKDENGNIIETPAQMFSRVAKAIAEVDRKFGEDPEKTYEEFFKAMSRLEFLPNSPTLFNAGTPMGQLSACFVIPVEDSLDSIFRAVHQTALIEQTGGGVGFSFSKLRPKGDVVKSTKGIASGPVSFMRVFDTATDVIKAGGKRRGAMMAVLSVDHPDVEEFIAAKSNPNFLTNFNLSVAVTDKFMRAVLTDGWHELINPRTGNVVRRVRARKIWKMIIKNAWKTGDPGLVFIDEVNRKNPTPSLGRIEATNPCGEVPLLPYESCNLGSVNLSRMVENGEINWEKLEKTVELGVHFLDNVIDANRYPIPEIEQMTKANRKIGLGVMGWAECLIKMSIPYDSKEAIRLGEKVMRFISETARRKSAELGEKRGSFPNFELSIWAKKYSAMRNATVTAIAPTGSISIIAGCSSSIEPLFAIAFIRRVLGGKTLLEINPLFEKIAKERKFYSGELLQKIARTGSIQNLREIPADVREIFKTALDISPEWHIRMQAAFQKHTDNAVSKTVNLPADATEKDVEKCFMLAWKLKCKGITVYRYGSKPQQVLYFAEDLRYLTADSEYAGGCITGTCPFPG
ncbi:MAG: adenosylcobalamin-dependent ribonucleoside-diphosphate reductase [Candidatus Hadarchaeales archaeon]